MFLYPYDNRMSPTVKRRKIPIDLQSLLISMGIGFVMLYLVFHALNGNHGVYALLKEQAREKTAAMRLTDVSAERQKLEHRVTMISGEMLDLDLLDEQARRVLGYTSPDEYIYLLSK